jgi:DNA-directed RNA polymerase subunit M/transcription elongation factor TFIIS
MTMQFCTKCDNMYYTKLMTTDDNDEMVTDFLTYYCQKCGHEELIKDKVTSILVTNANKTEQSYTRYINKYTKLDPSLPRTNRLQCPNPSCITHPRYENNSSEQKNDPPQSEAIYIRYDDVNMKYVYLCVHCDQVWNNENKL